MSDITRIFANWPGVIPKSGTVDTSYGESIPFNDYLLTSELILLVRPQPDAWGTRHVIMKISDIVGLRLTHDIDVERFTTMGFMKGGPVVSSVV